MAVRRKYRSGQPLRYRDGGAVPMAVEIDDKPMVAAEATPPPPEPSSATMAAPASPEEDSPMVAVLHATLRAEGLQREAERIRLEQQQTAIRQAPPPQVTIDQYVDELPNLTDHKRGFLKAHPELLDATRSRLLARHYVEALQAGVEDDTLDMDRYLLIAVQRDVEQHLARTVQEADQPRSEEREISTGPDSAAPPAPVRRPSMPITAPVSRDVPMPSGQRVSTGVTLSPEERQMAHLSYRDLPPAEAERIYATQKLRLQRERAEGRYPERERG